MTLKVLENTPAVLSLGKLCDENGYSYEWINGQKPHLIENGIRTQCNTENFVPIVVPVLSTSSCSNVPSSTSMSPSRHEIDIVPHLPQGRLPHHPHLCQATVRRAREDLSGIDFHPVSVSSEHVEPKERGDPFTKPTKNLKPNQKRRSRERMERPVLFRNPVMAARIQRKSRG